MVGNDHKKEKEDNNDENSNCLFHISFSPHPSPLPAGESEGVRGIYFNVRDKLSDFNL